MSENVNRLTYANWPLDSANDDVSLGLAALSQVVPSGVVATLTVPSTAAFLQTHTFYVLVGLRDGTTTIPSNREHFHVRVFDATTLAVISRTDSSRTHAVGEIVAPDITAADIRNNPGPLTTAGSIAFLGSSVAMEELFAGADRTFITYESGLPIVRAIQAADIPDLSASYATPEAVITYVSGAYVPLTRTVNGHALSANVSVSASDVGLGSVENAAASLLYVPLTRTVNGHALSGDVTVTKSDLSLGNVENTALSTWAGSTNLTTLGTIATGTWSGTAIAVAKGGTGSAFFTVAGPTATRIYTFPDAAATIARTDAANTFTLADNTTTTIAGGSVTGSGTTPFLSVTGTWNTSGAAPALLVNVISTASATLSPLMDLKVGSSSVAGVIKDGSVYGLTGFWRTAATSFNGANYMGISLNSGNSFIFYPGSATSAAAIGVAGFGVGSASYIAFNTNPAAGLAGNDVFLYRGAAAVLQLGADINGAAVSQTLQAANGITGTDKTGGNLTLRPGVGTGAGAVSSLIFQTPTLGSTGTTAQVQATRLTLTSTTLTFAEALNCALGATTGTKWGTAASQKQSFWNASPIVQPTTTIAAATFAANASAIASDTATFDGYTIGQVVKALRNTGLLA